MRQGELQGLKHVRQLDDRPAAEGAYRASRTCDDQVGPVTGDGTVEAEPGNQRPNRIGERYARKAVGCRLQQVA